MTSMSRHRERVTTSQLSLRSGWTKEGPAAAVLSAVDGKRVIKRIRPILT
jgi:hypothetical protein